MFHLLMQSMLRLTIELGKLDGCKAAKKPQVTVVAYLAGG